VLLCGATAAERGAVADAVRQHTAATLVPVRTKADLTVAGPDDALAVSAVTGHGLGPLRDAVTAALAARYPVPRETPLLLAARQTRAVEEAAAELHAFRAAWTAESLPVTVVAVHLRAAVHALETLIGAVDSDEVLGRVFAGFCVGK